MRKFEAAARALGSCALIAIAAMTAAQAYAQDAKPADQPAPASDDSDASKGKDEVIVVTGSRIRRDNFETPSPLDIITREDNVLAGTRSTASTLQAATITSGTSQINGAFLGYVSEGGAAAETIGLRGLGSSRTLVLLNGRRLAPSGTGSQLVSADLNVLPASMIKQIEILREGASSVYGSDAIAGVINIITDDKFNGITLDAYTEQPTQYSHDGRTYRGSITMGHVFDRGHITASFEVRDSEGLRVRDRSEFTCPRDLLFSPTTGAEVGSLDPATGQLACFPYALSSGVGVASGYGIAFSFNTGAQNRITYNNGDINSLRTVNGITRVSPSPVQLDDHVISPVTTYTGYLNGSYETDFLGDAEIYGEALFTRRESHQDSTYQLNIDTSQLSPGIEIYGGSYAGTPLSVYGYPTSPFFPKSLAAAGYNYFTPFVIPDKPSTSSQRVDFFRANGGLRGHLPFGDWRYDANFQYSRTKSSYSITGILTDHLNNALQTVLAPTGTPANLITTAVAGQAGEGNSYTCASNVSNGQIIAGASCVPLNMYDPNIMIGGHIPANVYNYLFSNIVGHTTFEEATISLNADGTLFQLPAGPLRAAVGYEHRYDMLDDVPSEAAQNGTLYNYSSAGITKGSDIVDEIYGEVDVPLVKNKPLFRSLDLGVSGRYTHYESYGSDFTYHLNAQWAPNDVIRFRGNYGTSFRAPNLYEQFVADQTGFYGSGVDPCAGWYTAYAPGTTLFNNCKAALEPILGVSGAQAYLSTAGPQVITRGGHGLLKAEKSNTWGGGVVITLPPTVADLSVAIDYWNITVKDEVAVLGNLILDRCYEATDFPNNQYCDLIGPRRPAGNAQQGTLSSFVNPYLNVAKQKASGIDFDVRYNKEIAGGRLKVEAQATRNIHQYFQLFAEDPIVDYNGTLGEQGAGAGPKWVGNLDVRYTLPSNKVTVRYGLKYVGKQDSTDNIGSYTAGLGVGPVNTDFVAEAYWEHALSVQVKFEDITQITLGVNNLFNAHPPTVSQIPASNGLYTRIGNYFNSSNYDYYGRTLFLNLTTNIK